MPLATKTTITHCMWKMCKLRDCVADNRFCRSMRPKYTPHMRNAASKSQCRRGVLTFQVPEKGSHLGNRSLHPRCVSKLGSRSFEDTPAVSRLFSFAVQLHGHVWWSHVVAPSTDRSTPPYAALGAQLIAVQSHKNKVRS